VLRKFVLPRTSNLKHKLVLGIITSMSKTLKTPALLAGNRGVVTLKGAQPTDTAAFLANVLATLVVVNQTPTKTKELAD